MFELCRNAWTVDEMNLVRVTSKDMGILKTSIVQYLPSFVELVLCYGPAMPTIQSAGCVDRRNDEAVTCSSYQ